jgi:hypothetical protein
VGRASFVIAVAGLGSGYLGAFALAGPPSVESRVVVDGPTAISERKAIAGAMRLLARLPERVAVIDAEQASPDVKATLLRLDAFTIRDSRVVYLVRQSALLQGAVQRQAFHTYALASVIWHEMAHVEGGDEREARRREQSLWTTFVRDQHVDEVTALRYLVALTKRPDAHLGTGAVGHGAASVTGPSERTTLSPEKIINAHPVRPENWPRLHIPDPVGGQAASKALDLAWERLPQPDCSAVLTTFNGQAGRPLAHRLGEGDYPGHAKSGDPNDGTLPTWPRFDATRRAFLEFKGWHWVRAEGTVSRPAARPRALSARRGVLLHTPRGAW